MASIKQPSFAQKYQKLELLGKGTYGSVFKVREKCTSEVFAAKFISLVGLSQKQILKADEERLIHSRLSHPNILKFCESYLEDQTLIFVMEYCEYGDLQVFLRRRKETGANKLPQEVVLNIFLQLLFGLHYLHSEGVLHRDLKPSNIFVDSNGSVKIADFGISKVLHPEMDLHISNQSSSGSLNLHLPGTPMYASPQACRNQQLTYKSDVWSIGCVLYQLCTLQPAFAADNILALATKINNDKVKSIGHGYTEDLAALIQWMLEKKAELRPTIEEILALTFIKKNIKLFEQSQLEHSRLETNKMQSSIATQNLESSCSESKVEADCPTYPIIHHYSDLQQVQQEEMEEDYYIKLKESCINLLGGSQFNQIYHEVKELNRSITIINPKDKQKMQHELMKIYGHEYYDLAKAVLELVQNQAKFNNSSIDFQQ